MSPCPLCGAEFDDRHDRQEGESVTVDDSDVQKCVTGSAVFVHRETDAQPVVDDDAETETVLLTDGGQPVDDDLPTPADLAHAGQLVGTAVEHAAAYGEGEVRNVRDDMTGHTAYVEFGAVGRWVDVGELAVSWGYYDDHPQYATEAVEAALGLAGDSEGQR